MRILKELKRLLSDFIRKKYQNCTTKIGFSSERELFNIFNRMLNSAKGFFNKTDVRKILSQFWLSCKEVISLIRIRGQTDPTSTGGGMNDLVKINQVDEIILKNNFYMRLEIIARGRFIYETFECKQPATVPAQRSATQLRSASADHDDFRSALQGRFPIHQAVFESNLRTLSKILKQEQDGVFYAEKN